VTDFHGQNSDDKQDDEPNQIDHLLMLGTNQPLKIETKYPCVTLTLTVTFERRISSGEISIGHSKGNSLYCGVIEPKGNSILLNHSTKDDCVIGVPIGVFRSIVHVMSPRPKDCP